MRFTILAFVLWIGCQSLNAQQPLMVHNAKSYQFVSKVNNKGYVLGVSVPDDYNPTNKYPVFYILDGYYAADIAHGAHKTLGFFKEIEDIIVVTISGAEKTKNEWFINRWGDLTFTNDPRYDTAAVASWNLPTNSLLSGKGDQFLQVLKTEVFPIIEKQYNTNGERGISGHSLGGLYVGNLMFKAGDVFEKFGINSPSFRSWNNNDIRIAEKVFSEKHTELNAKVILTFGGLEGDKNINNLKEYEALLKSHYANIETANIIFEGETHASVVAAMLSRNMLYLYAKKEKNK